MTGFRGACRGTLATQINLVDAAGALLSGPGEALILPANNLVSISDVANENTITGVDKPCLNIPDRTTRDGTAVVTATFCCTTDYETIAFMTDWTTYGDGETTLGIEPPCGGSGCYCADDPENSARDIAITTWSCKFGCDGSIVRDPKTGDLVQCVRGYTRLSNGRVTQKPELVAEDGTPSDWVIEFDAFPNANYGQGPGGVTQKVDPVTGAPAGPNCYSYCGDSTVTAPLDCAVLCNDHPVGLDSQTLVLV